ncbi:MAG: hypothetical protein WDO18_22965 [Acidobacteriota bacterium]
MKSGDTFVTMNGQPYSRIEPLGGNRREVRRQAHPGGVQAARRAAHDDDYAGVEHG